MPIPISRILEKLDAYNAKDDFAGAERHLRYWEAEAEATGDDRGLITVTCEEMGMYRKAGKEDEAVTYAKKALGLIEKCRLSGTVSAATVMINCATVFTAFGKTDEALPLFLSVKEIYERELSPNDERVGSLYNNYAAALVSTDRCDEALANYEKALAVMQTAENAEGELAVTHLNMANAIEAKLGLFDGAEAIAEHVAKAEELLHTPSLPRDGHYAFVCDKCVPVFDYYGYFATAKELRETADKLYERS